MRTCNDCGIDIITKGRHYHCPKCRYKREGRGFDLNKWLKRNYGITEEDYNKKLEAQNNCCAICHRHKDEFPKGLAVDHNHLTGKIRGLLCTACNHGIAHFFEDITTMENAAQYLERHSNPIQTIPQPSD